MTDIALRRPRKSALLWCPQEDNPAVAVNAVNAVTLSPYTNFSTLNAREGLGVTALTAVTAGLGGALPELVERATSAKQRRKSMGEAAAMSRSWRVARRRDHHIDQRTLHRVLSGTVCTLDGRAGAACPGATRSRR